MTTETEQDLITRYLTATGWEQVSPYMWSIGEWQYVPETPASELQLVWMGWKRQPPEWEMWKHCSLPEAVPLSVAIKKQLAWMEEKR